MKPLNTIEDARYSLKKKKNIGKFSSEEIEPFKVVEHSFEGGQWWRDSGGDVIVAVLN